MSKLVKKNRFISIGMTLAEVLVSVTILTIIMLGIAGTISITFSASRHDRIITQAVSFAQETIESIKYNVYAPDPNSSNSNFMSLANIPYTYLSSLYDPQVNTKLIYSVDVTTIDPTALKKVTVKVFCQDPSASTPSPKGDKLIQFSTYIAKK